MHAWMFLQEAKLWPETVKNNSTMYERVKTPEYGLWEQVRVDHEKEFYLTLYIHEHPLQPTVPLNSTVASVLCACN